MLSEGLHDAIQKNASADERSMSAYIRLVMSKHIGYVKPAHSKASDIDLTDIEFPDEK